MRNVLSVVVRGDAIDQLHIALGDSPLRSFLLRIKLHQKSENPMRRLLWQLILRSKLLADRSLEGAETQRFVPRIMFAEFREIDPLLRHFEKRRANPQIGGLPRRGQALGR